MANWRPFHANQHCWFGISDTRAAPAARASAR